MNNLIENVKKWFHDKGIIANSDPLKQLEKTQEELTETRDAMLAYGLLYDLNADKMLIGKAANEVADGIGDILVTLIGVSEMVNLTLEQCLQTAYDVISKRSGKMVDGVFVKDGGAE